MKLLEKNLQPKPNLIKTGGALRGTEMKKEGFYFDPRSEITEEERRNIEKLLNLELRKNRNNSLSQEFVLDHIIYYLTIFPERKGYIKIGSKILDDLVQSAEAGWDTTDENELKNINKLSADVQTTILEGDLPYVINAFWRTKMIMAESYFNNNIVPELQSLKGKLFKKIILQEWKKINTTEKLRIIILFPEIQKDIKLSEDDKDDLQRYDLDGSRQSFLIEAAELSLIYPEFRKEYQLEPEKLKRTKDNIKQLDIKNDIVNYISHLFYLYVLTAERAEITPEGKINIIPKQKPLTTIEPLPPRPV